jgi:hypothetical protein
MEKIISNNTWIKSRKTGSESCYTREETLISRNCKDDTEQESYDIEELLKQKSQALNNIILEDDDIFPSSILDAPLLRCIQTSRSKISELNI